MHQVGVYMGPGLPNTISATQKMDGLYETFKGMCDRSAQNVFTWKVYDRSWAVEKLRNKDREDGFVEADEKIIKPAQLNNNNLPEITNGKPGYPVENKLFDYCFTHAKIFNSWLNIGFVPFSQNPLKHKKVRYMLGKGRGSDDTRETIEKVQANYGKLKKDVKEAGINLFVFHAKLSVHKHESMAKTEDEQVEALLKGKSAFSAGRQCCELGFQLQGSSAIIRAQQEQLKQHAEESAKAAAKKNNDELAKLEKVKSALARFHAPDKTRASEWKAISSFVLPRHSSTEQFLSA